MCGCGLNGVGRMDWTDRKIEKNRPTTENSMYITYFDSCVGEVYFLSASLARIKRRCLIIASAFIFFKRIIRSVNIVNY